LNYKEHHALQCLRKVTQLVTISKNDIDVTPKNKGPDRNASRARKIGPNTPFDTCEERLSPFGGLLALVKFLDLFRFQEIFEKLYLPPSREPLLGHYKMVLGIIMLLFIGFNRLWHFLYIQLDPMVCGILGVDKLPHATTFWRYLDSLGINQARPLFKIMAAMRERVWDHCELKMETVHVDIDTTVETVYGEDLQGARKGHNTSHRGKKGFRPVMAFISETREFLAGSFRRGSTITGAEVGRLIGEFPKYLPACINKIIIRADGEFFCYEAIKAATACGFSFIIAIRAAKPIFDELRWYKVNSKDEVSYNDCMYCPMGWDQAYRFVAMRIPIEKAKESSDVEKRQLALFEDERYKYRVFVTEQTKKAHKVIAEYDGRADAENLVGEVKREGLAAIPSAKFKNNYAFYCIVMLAYNLWRWMKLTAAMTVPKEKETSTKHPLNAIAQNTIRVARYVLLLIAAKVVFTANRLKVRCSIYDSRVPSFLDFLNYLDHHRAVRTDWPPSEFNCQPLESNVQEKSCTVRERKIAATAKSNTS
jgi:hypothetical protein